MKVEQRRGSAEYRILSMVNIVSVTNVEWFSDAGRCVAVSLRETLKAAEDIL